MKVITGWRALLIWIAVFVSFVTYWELGKAIYCYCTQRRYSVFGEKGGIL